jgi:hypothetical protein
MIKNIVIGVLAVTTLLFGYFATTGQSIAFSGVSTGPAHEQQETFKQGLQLGQRGTPLTLYASGTCTLQGNFSITASTTRSVSCTGITLQNNTTYTGAAGDIVDVQLVASTSLASQYLVKSAQASTTANGSVELQLMNMTGTSATPSATFAFGSSTQVQIYR